MLELGTYTGYSALCMAESLEGDDAELHTIDLDDEIEEFTSGFFDKSPYADKIHFHIGDALEILPTHAREFYIVFIDANTSTLIYYNILFFD